MIEIDLSLEQFQSTTLSLFEYTSGATITNLTVSGIVLQNAEQS